MRLWRPLPRAAGAVELLDRPAPLHDLRECLDDVARLNVLFGGHLVTLRHVRRLLGRVPRDRVATVLDVGTGSADVPRALVRWARRGGRRVRVYALDREVATLDVARREIAGYPEIALLAGDALALPFRPRSVDVVISALTLHHLEPGPAGACLAAMDRAARVGFVVNDLYRSRAAYALVWLATRLLARNRMSRHDGPLSVLRAYTPREMRGLCAGAGLRGVRVRRYGPLLRQCAIGMKPSAPATP